VLAASTRMGSKTGRYLLPDRAMDERVVLVTRRVPSVLGFTILEWSCALRAQLSREDPSAYFFDFRTTGRWYEGTSVLVTGKYRPDDAVLELRVTEQLPGRAARSTRLFFEVTPGGPISLIDGRS
jgi:hypothetical protein